MDGSGAALLHSDYLVLLAALRGMVLHRWVDDRTRVRAEIMRFIALVEDDRPRDVLFQGAFDVARSLVVLGRPFCALHRVELLILNDGVGRNEATAAMCGSGHESGAFSRSGPHRVPKTATVECAGVIHTAD